MTITCSVDDLNTILTALYKERERAEKSNDEKALKYLNSAIESVQKFKS